MAYTLSGLVALERMAVQGNASELVKKKTINQSGFDMSECECASARVSYFKLDFTLGFGLPCLGTVRPSI